VKRPKKYPDVGKLNSNGNLYVHKAYLYILPQEELMEAISRLKEEVGQIPDFTIIKWGMKTGNFTFIQSPDFNSSHEPMMGDSWLVKFGQGIKFLRQQSDPYIYHHKWLMVKDDYSGFNVEISKMRSAAWSGLTGYNKRSIGRKAYWEREVVPRIKSSI
jgi:hypothetical protein